MKLDFELTSDHRAFIEFHRIFAGLTPSTREALVGRQGLTVAPRMRLPLNAGVCIVYSGTMIATKVQQKSTGGVPVEDRVGIDRPVAGNDLMAISRPVGVTWTGDLYGEFGVLTSEKVDATVFAVSEVVLLQLNSSLLNDLLSDTDSPYPMSERFALAKGLAREGVAKLQRNVQYMDVHYRRGLDKRLARMLAFLHLNGRTKNINGHPFVEGIESQVEMQLLLGVRAPLTNAEASLQERKLAIRTSLGYQILDTDGLVSYSQE